MPARTLDRIANAPRIGLILAGIGVLLAVAYTFLAAGHLAGVANSQLDPDRHGALGLGLWHYGTFSYYPGGVPTVERGPVYPALIAAALALSGGWWPGAVQLLQALLFGLLVLIVHRTALRLWGPRRALVATAIVLVHPFVFMFAARIMVELTATLLFTALVAGTLWLARRPTIARAAAVGVILGLTILSKGVFLPMLAVAPFSLALVIERGRRMRMAVTVLVVALLPIGAWTARNYRLTGRIIPVQLLAGYNIQRGDTFVERASAAPFSYGRLWEMGDGEIARLESEIPPGATGWRREAAMDSLFTARSFEHYRREPGFLAAKIAIDALWFWTLGENPAKTLAAALLQVPLLVFFLIASVSLVRRRGLRSMAAMHVSWVLLYWLLHMPIFAFFRLSVVLIPTMVIYAVGLLGGRPAIEGQPEKDRAEHVLPNVESRASG
jgi:4-amino-4-deoxy-L-arabinose transferase-like glycosyltransferase